MDTDLSPKGSVDGSHCTRCSAMYSTGERRSGGVPVGRLPKGSPSAVFHFFF